MNKKLDQFHSDYISNIYFGSFYFETLKVGAFIFIDLHVHIEICREAANVCLWLHFQGKWETCTYTKKNIKSLDSYRINLGKYGDFKWYQGAKACIC